MKKIKSILLLAFFVLVLLVGIFKAGRSEAQSCTLSLPDIPDQTITLPVNYAHFSSTATGCPSEQLTYKWEITSGTGVLSTPTLDNTDITSISAWGIHYIKLTVTASGGTTKSTTVTLNVKKATDTSTSSTPTPTTTTSTTTTSTTPTTPVNSPVQTETVQTTTNTNSCVLSVGNIPDTIVTLPTNSATIKVTTNDCGTLSYDWKITNGTSGSVATNAKTKEVTFSNLYRGVYYGQVTVTNNFGASKTNSFQITVQPSNSINTNIDNPPTTNCTLKVTNGSNLTTTLPTNKVQLTSAGSSCVKNYKWTASGTPGFTFTPSETDPNPEFGNLSFGVYYVTLTGYDANGKSASSVVKVTVQKGATTTVTSCTPTVSNGTNLTTSNSALQLSATGNSCVTSYAWTVTPVGPTFAPSANSQNPVISGLVPGNVYYVSVTGYTATPGVSATSAIKITTSNATNTSLCQYPTAPLGCQYTGGDANQCGKVLTCSTTTTQCTPTTTSGSSTTNNTTTDPTGKACTHYASPAGGGNGLSFSSPFKVANFWNVAGPGKTLCLLNGKYTGVDSMVLPPNGLSGASGNPITITALNDGGAEFDGQGQRQPIEFVGNSYFVLRGFNAFNAGINRSVVTFKDNSNYNRVERVVGKAEDGDNNVFRSWNAHDNTFLDTGGIGGRKTYSSSQHGDAMKMVRAWGFAPGKSTYSGPPGTFKLSYNSYDSKCYNCISSETYQDQPKSYELLSGTGVGGAPTGIFYNNYEKHQADNWGFGHDGFDISPEIANINIKGSVAYIRKTADKIFSQRTWPGPMSFEIKGVYIDNSISLVEPGSTRTYQPKSIYLSGGQSGLNSATSMTIVGPAGASIGGSWSTSNNYVNNNCAALVANGGNVLNPSIAGINTGATIMKRYDENGDLTNQDLWPWPMDRRIKEAMTAWGYPAISVTEDVFSLCGGTMPADIKTKLDAMYAGTSSGVGGQTCTTSTSSVTNPAPMVNAGSSQSINLPTSSVTLNGTASVATGSVISTKWSQASGPTNANIISPSSLTTSVTGLTNVGSYNFTLTVTSDKGVTVYSTVVVTVNDSGVSTTNNSISVTALANPASVTLPTSSSSLSGTAIAPAGALITSVAWTQVSGPVNAAISNSTTPNATASGMTASGTYTFKYTVNTNKSTSNFATVSITVSSGLANPVNPVTSADLNSIVNIAKAWLNGDKSGEASLAAWTDPAKIDQAMALVVPNNFPQVTTGKKIDQVFTLPQFASKYAGVVGYDIYIPPTYNPAKQYPVMVWLHGGGTPGTWRQEMDHLNTFDFSDNNPDSRSYPRLYIGQPWDTKEYILVAPIAPVAPMADSGDAGRWFRPYVEPYLKDLLYEIGSKYNINWRKIAFAGYSMGGVGMYEQVLRLNDRMSGGMASAGSFNYFPGDALVNTPFYMIHGTNDAEKGVRGHRTAIEYPRMAKHVMEAAGNEVVLKEYAGGHSWTTEAEGYWKNFVDWVYPKTLNPYPNHVVALNKWTTYGSTNNNGVDYVESASPRTFYVSIDSYGSGAISYPAAITTGDAGATSGSGFDSWSLKEGTVQLQGGKADVRITGPNQITITTQNVTKLSVWGHANMGIDPSKPVTINIDGQTITRTCSPSLLAAMQNYQEMQRSTPHQYYCKMSVK